MILPRSRLVDLRDRMQTSFWFVPAIMFVVALLLAVGMIRLDVFLSGTDALNASPWFPKFGASAGRAILSTIASGMVTVTGVVFSLTVVTLQLASSQFGPRLLRAFMTSLGNQIVLGTFTATFVYCLIIIGTVREDEGFVPQMSIATGILLGIAAIGVLIYFIHHVATSIRVETVIASVTQELGEVIEALFPSRVGEEPSTDGPRPALPTSENFRPVCASAGGYIRNVDHTMLMAAAVEHDLVLHIEQTPGDFVVGGTELARIWPKEAASDEVLERVRESIVLGRDRTPLQDVAFAIRQLVELSLRALSPGMNDPFTAIECVNRLCEALCRAVVRPRPSPFRLDEDGRLRVVAEPMSLPAMVRAAFDPIARSGGHNGDVGLRLVEAIATVATCAHHEDDRRFLVSYARDMAEQLRGQMTLERDRCALDVRLEQALAQVDRRWSEPSGDDDEAPSLALQSEAKRGREPEPAAR